MLKIKKIAGKGRGTVANRAITKGELIEAAPVCTFPPEQRMVLSETALSEYYFVRPSEYRVKGKRADCYIVFGISSFCNHSDKPNAEVRWISNDLGLWAHLTALRDIRSGEEVTIFYTNIEEYPAAKKFVKPKLF